MRHGTDSRARTGAFPGPEPVATAIAAAAFSDEQVRCATHGHCATFALALADVLHQQGLASSLCAFGSEPRWEQEYLGAVLHGKPRPPRRFPDCLRAGYFNHVVVQVGDRYYNIEGSHTAAELAERYAASGIIEVAAAALRRKTGFGDRYPLYHDREFAAEVRQRLNAAFAHVLARRVAPPD